MKEAMKDLGNFLLCMFITAACAIVWIPLVLFGGVIGFAVIFLAALAAAIAHSKGKDFPVWLLWGTLFPGIALIAAIAVRRPPVVVYVTKEP